MKTNFLISLVFYVIFSFLFSNVQSQVPESFNYQAIIRDAVGDPIEDQVVSLRISIIATNPGGTTVYTEDHADTTNAFGLVTVSVGTGTTSDDFSSIDWSSDNYFLKIEVDPTGGTSYEWYGTTQLLSVPYALYAKESGSMAGNWTQSGDDIYYITGNVGIGTDNPYGVLEVQANDLPANDSILFEVKNADGQVVFGVYPEGVRVYVDDLGGKGTRGGFAVGGFSSGKGPVNEYLRVTPDSVRVYVSEDGKGTRGGFAVGGFSSGKGLTNEYLHVTPDSTNILTQGSSSGFTINNFDGELIRYTNITPNNTFIGYQAGANNDPAVGKDNIFLGTETGRYSTIGYANTFIGQGSGKYFASGNGNAFLGNSTGRILDYGLDNVIIGHGAGNSMTQGQVNTIVGAYAASAVDTGWLNVYLGAHAGEYNYHGNYNTVVGSWAGGESTCSNSILIGFFAGHKVEDEQNIFIGNFSGDSHYTGTNNVYIGNYAGRKADSSEFSTVIGNLAGYYNQGAENIFIGGKAGYNHVDGSCNTYVGTCAGLNDTTGYDNVFIGYKAGHENSAGSNIIIGRDAGFNSVGYSNIMIGKLAGFNCTGTRNILIGQQAGFNETGSGKLYIENYGGDSTQALIWGDMLNDILRFNGMVGIDTTPGMALDVKGNARFSEVGSGTYASDLNLTADGTLTTASSDSRLKENIIPLENSLSKVLELNAYTFTWKDDASGKNDIGLIAQEVKDIYPELVFKNKTDGYYGINYSRFPAILIEATKEQQAYINELDAEISALKAQNQEMQQRLEKLEKLLQK